MKVNSASTADSPLYHTVGHAEAHGQAASITSNLSMKVHSNDSQVTKYSACIGTVCALIAEALEAWSYIAAIGSRNLPPRHVQHRDAQVSLIAWPDNLGGEHRQIVPAAAILLSGLCVAYCITTRRTTQVLPTTCTIQGFAAFWLLRCHYEINSISDWACNRNPEQQAVFGPDVNYSAICSTQVGVV